MDETIGAKGGKNDIRRSLIISKKRQKKIEDEEIKELEKKVRKKQIYTLIKTLPIVVGGGFIKTICGPSIRSDEKNDEKVVEGKDDIDLKPVGVRKKSRTITTQDGKNVIVYFDDNRFTEKTTEEKGNEENGITDKANYVDETSIKVKDSNHINTNEKTFVNNFNESNADTNTNANANKFYADSQNLDFNNLPDSIEQRFQRLKSRRIVDEYERQLKDVRYDLRRVIYEYNVLVDEDEKAILSEEAEAILDKLSDIISRIEVLKSKLRVEQLDKYDDNYIYYLIEGYLEEFKDGKLVSEIKDSPLYIMISKKIDELDRKKDDFQQKVSDKKDELEEKEQDFDELKKRYVSIDKINADLLRFQYEQDRILSDIRDKVHTAASVKERVETQVVGLNKQSARLLRLLSLQMFLPGPKSAKTLAATTAAYLYFYNNVVKPKTIVKKYRVITVKDYHDDIANSIDFLDDAETLLRKTSKQIDLTIRDIEERFSDYIGVIPECDELLRNLRKVKSELMEKEYEMEKIKQQQEIELKKNDAKVKTIGEYPVN